jgi:hypothetical protein
MDGGAQYVRLLAAPLAFAAPADDLPRLRALYASVAATLETHVPRPGCFTFGDLAAMIGASNRPSVRRDQVAVMTHEATCSILPEVPASPAGAYTVTLRWDELMLPRSHALVRQCIAPNTEVVVKSLAAGRETILPLARFRTSDGRYLRAQAVTGEGQPLTFHMPGPERIIEVLFTTDTPYARVEPSSIANYHRHFIDRAGGLEQAVVYLATSPYKEILSTLADVTTPQGQKPGWLIEHPARYRRALHHVDLWRVVGAHIPEKTADYMPRFAVQLPAAAGELLERGILERGFVLRCASCRYESWYPADVVGQEFRCACCYKQQGYRTNPLWLYKLPEVIYLGLSEQMQVPLLALNHMKHQSRYHFSWAPDADVYRPETHKGRGRNLDIICLSDGHLYVGEAKSNDEIEEEQITFYEEILGAVPVDGLIFATSQPRWSVGTVRPIDDLRARWGERIITLTGEQLTVSAQRTAHALEPTPKVMR